MPIATVEAGGAKLRVRTGGAGSRAIVFAADPPNVLEHYAPLFARLKAHARVVAFEPPGFGYSRKPRGHRHTVEAEADVVIALLDRLALGPAVLAFPCMSAYVALRVAARRSDLASGLVLIQAPSWHEQKQWVARVDARGLLRTPVVGQALNFLRQDAIVRGWYRAAVGAPQRTVAFEGFALESLEHGARFPLATAFQHAFHGEPPRIEPVSCPTLSVWGGADRSHRKSDPASIRAHAPQAELVTLETSGHFPELEETARFCDALLAWMARHAL